MNSDHEKLTKKEFAGKLETRTKQFAVNVIRLSNQLTTSTAGKVRRTGLGELESLIFYESVS